MKVEVNSVVSIHFELTNDDGVKLDSSAEQEPLVYLHGNDNLIPGLENALKGCVAGDKLQVAIQPEEGYGPVLKELIEEVSLQAFEGVDDVKAGMQFETDGPEGEVQIITVQEVDGDTVTVNGNHPLAGQVLHFDVTVEAIREATKEELDHGHVHSNGCEH